MVSLANAYSREVFPVDCFFVKEVSGSDEGEARERGGILEWGGRLQRATRGDFETSWHASSLGTDWRSVILDATSDRMAQSRFMT